MCVYVERYSTPEDGIIQKESSVAPLIGVAHCSTMSVMGSHIRERIKAARNHACLTQEQLGERIGVSKSAVSMWETTNMKKWTRPTYENLQALSRITGASIEWLMSDDSDINPDWVRPAEILEFPFSSSRTLTKAEEMVMLFSQLDEDEQEKILSYLKTRLEMTRA